MDLEVGSKVGNITVIGPIVTKGKHCFSLVRCDCGKEWTARRDSIKRGQITSCGCERTKRLLRMNTKHGHTTRYSCSRAYQTWADMMDRCRNSNSPVFKHYGGRGIRVCAAWHDFRNFLADMGDRPDGMSLDRIDNSQGYSKSNCQWTTHQKQMQNTRRNQYVQFNGEKLCVSEACRGDWPLLDWLGQQSYFWAGQAVILLAFISVLFVALAGSARASVTRPAIVRITGEYIMGLVANDLSLDGPTFPTMVRRLRLSVESVPVLDPVPIFVIASFAVYSRKVFLRETHGRDIEMVTSSKRSSVIGGITRKWPKQVIAWYGLRFKEMSGPPLFNIISSCCALVGPSKPNVHSDERPGFVPYGVFVWLRNEIGRQLNLGNGDGIIHRSYLVAQRPILPMTIETAGTNGEEAYPGSSPNPHYFSFPPLPIPLVVGILFVFLAIKGLDYTFDRTDYLFDVGLFGGFVVFAFGFLLIFVSFFTAYVPKSWLPHVPSAPPNSFSENIIIQPIVVPELEFRDVQRQILGGNLVECPDHAPLNQGPEALNCLGVDCTDNVLTSRMVNALVHRKLTVQMLVANPFVSAEQTDLGRDAFADECFESGGANICDHTGNHVAFATDSASDNRLARSTRCTAAAALVPMAVLGFATDKSFVHFHNSHELVKFLVHERSADPMRHVEGGLVRSEPHDAHDLERANALLGSEHHMNDAKPHAERLVGVLEDGPGDDREPIATIRGAGIALPLEGHRGDSVLHVMAAARASDAIGPAMRDEVRLAGFLSRESLFPLGYRHLVDWFGSLCHDRHSLSLEGI